MAALIPATFAAEAGAPARPDPFDVPAPDSPAAAWWRDSMQTRDARLGWWREARFGMFVHWGVYSHLGNDYQGRKGGGYAEHIQRVLKIPIPEYRAEVAGRFNPVNCDVLINYDAPAGSAGGTFAVSFGGQTPAGTVQAGTNLTLPLGRVTLAPGPFEIRVSANEVKGAELFRLRRLELKPVAAP